jgi:hypothetical protein
MKPLSRDENELRGAWIVVRGRVAKDDVTERIEWLVAHSLRRLGTDASGWDTLFRDPADGRLWEMIYPQSEMQGGGPPLLRHLSPDAARAKYRW